ncbi:hypothetical protein [Nonomuraea sp. SBT364]|uniref:hypothetical protein n=1 Tax=Nonomuraea sp. SBT364 TaxID=1580530 RepID=UPI00066E7DDA|nr:hypothetical protein [Nonomuraea sp. SBT364]
MSITTFLEILLGIMLIFSALVAAAVLWVAPPRRHSDRSSAGGGRTTPAEDRPEWPGRHG